MSKSAKACGALFMALAIAVAIPLGINRSLAKLREDAAGSYYYDQGGYAIFQGIEKRRDAANSLVTLAERYVEANPELAGPMETLGYQIEASERTFDEDQTFTTEESANRALDEPARLLAEALEKVNLAEKDKKYPRQLLAQMESEQDKIQRSSYNDEARAYNEKLEGLKPLAFQKPMAVFEPLERTVTSAQERREAEKVEESPETSGPESAEQAADRLASRAEEWADNVASGADAFANGVAEGTEDLIKDILDGVFS
ncbi:hypothetical protein [Acutalibacter intestini]|uniref:hypothetical protein n=1 Tax=Acutalibacter intestini TaxID=3093659 RepID=UPI002AC93FAC|nr:hypothetical protein [Acutalibacter sp. M00204]